MKQGTNSHLRHVLYICTYYRKLHLFYKAENKSLNSSTSLKSRFVFIVGRLDINLKTSKLQIGWKRFIAVSIVQLARAFPKRYFHFTVKCFSSIRLASFNLLATFDSNRLLRPILISELRLLRILRTILKIAAGAAVRLQCSILIEAIREIG